MPSEQGGACSSSWPALPERDRAVIDLVDIAGLRPKEAAAALGLTPGTVRMRLMRARARLRKLSGRGGHAVPAPPGERRHAATERHYGNGQHNHQPDQG